MPQTIEDIRLKARIRSIKYRSEPGYQERANRNQRAYVARLRIEVLDVLGSFCHICGINDQRVLQLDHLAGNGNQQRRLYVQRQIYRLALTKPFEYQVLCANCNWMKRNDICTPEIQLLRDKALDLLGGICCACECSNRRVLHFDHKNGGGSEDRRGTRNGRSRYKRIISFIDKYQLLCANCHQIKTVEELRLADLQF